MQSDLSRLYETFSLHVPYFEDCSNLSSLPTISFAFNPDINSGMAATVLDLSPEYYVIKVPTNTGYESLTFSKVFYF